MYRAKAEKELTTDYPLKQVKESIGYLFEHFPDRYLFREEENNEAFGLYHFPMTSNNRACIIDLTLSEADGGKTRIVISAIPLHASHTSQAVLTSLLNAYLLALGKVLQGEKVAEVQPTRDSSGGAWVIVFLIVAALSLLTAFIS